MHAVYFDKSSNNAIERNVFGAMDCTLIKLRSGSDANRIVQNTFRYEGEALVKGWFCNADVAGQEHAQSGSAVRRIAP